MIYIVFFISITAHEIGHLVTSKIFNIRIGKPRLGIFGYSIKELKPINFNKPIHKILVFLSGPIFNLFLAIFFYKIEVPYKLKFYMFYTNLFLCIINLLPILPLDGANILKCLLEKRFEYKISSEIVLLISKIILILLSLIYCFAIFYLKNVWIFCIIIYLWILYFKEEKKFELYLKILNKVKDLKV